MTIRTSYLHKYDQKKLERILELAAASHDHDRKEEFGDDMFLRRSKAMQEEADTARRLADAKGRIAWCNSAIAAAQVQREGLGRETDNDCSIIKQKIMDLQKQRDQMQLLADAAQIELQRAAADQMDAAQQRQAIEARCEALSQVIIEMFDDAEVWRSESKSVWVQRVKEVAHHSAEVGILRRSRSQTMQKAGQPSGIQSNSEETRKNGLQPIREKKTRDKIAEGYEEQAASIYKEIQRLREENLSLTAEAKKHCTPIQKPRGALELARRHLLDFARKVKWLEDACAATRSQLAERNRHRHKLEEKLLGLWQKLSEVEATSATHLGKSKSKFTPQELDVQAAALCLQERAEGHPLARCPANILHVTSSKVASKAADKDAQPLKTVNVGSRPITSSGNRRADKMCISTAPAEQPSLGTTDNSQHSRCEGKNLSGEANQTSTSLANVETLLSTAESLRKSDSIDDFSVPTDHLAHLEKKVPCKVVEKHPDRDYNQGSDQESFGELFDISSIEAWAKKPFDEERYGGVEQVLERPCNASHFDIGSIEALTAEIEASLAI